MSNGENLNCIENVADNNLGRRDLCKDCGKLIKPGYLLRHSLRQHGIDKENHKVNSKVRVTCSICNESVLKRNLKRHLDVHCVKESSFNCILCFKAFSNLSNKKRHDEAVHQKMTYDCKFCDKRYKRKDKLVNHVKKFHSD